MIKKPVVFTVLIVPTTKQTNEDAKETKKAASFPEVMVVGTILKNC